MATTVQIKRSTVSGRTPNTTSSGNSTYIAAGELAINLADGQLFTSNGSSLIVIGSNLVSLDASSYGTFGGAVNATSFNSTGATTSTFANNVTVTGVANAVTLNITGTVTSTFANNVTITGTANTVALNVTGTSAVSANGGFATRSVTIADGTSVTINANITDLAVQTNTQAAGTLTINAPTGTFSNGQKFIFRLQSTNVQTFSWNAVFDQSTDLSLPSTSSGSSKYDYLGFIYNSTSSKWQLIAKNFGF